MAAGCLFTALVGPLFQGLIMSIFVGFYLPMMLGSKEVMSSALVLSFLWPLVKAGFAAVIVVTVLCFVPVLGGLIAQSPGIQNFLLGVIIFRLVAGPALAEASEKYSISSSVYPGFWSAVGYLIIAGLLVRLILYGGAFASSIAKNRTASEKMEAILMALAPSLGVLGGLLPLFMYAQHVRLALVAVVK